MIRKGDDKVIAATSRDTVAAEAPYHRSCYRNYTRQKSLLENGEENEPFYQKAERESHEKLFEY